MKRALAGLALIAALGLLPRARQALGPAPRSVEREQLEGYFPDVVLSAHDGTKVHFYRDCLEGKVVLVNFIFTRCQSYCPLATENLAIVQRKLGASVGRDVFLYSISVDPEHDTPEVLATFARKHGVGPGWRFLTGDPEDLKKIREKFGSFEKSRMNHTGLVTCGSEPAGRWITIPAVTDPDEIVAAVQRLPGAVAAR